MPCRIIRKGDATVIACSRGSGKRCSTAGCSGYGVALCDYPLSGSQAGQTCDRALCERCRVRRERGVDYCPVHAEVA